MVNCFISFKRERKNWHCQDGHAQSYQDKSAARLCCWVAAWVAYMLCTFYLVKNHKIAYNSATIEAREK
jgi:hypothetical protein